MSDDISAPSEWRAKLGGALMLLFFLGWPILAAIAIHHGFDFMGFMNTLETWIFIGGVVGFFVYVGIGLLAWLLAPLFSR